MKEDAKILLNMWIGQLEDHDDPQALVPAMDLAEDLKRALAAIHELEDWKDRYGQLNYHRILSLAEEVKKVKRRLDAMESSI